jgi:sugar lactone lactonase YvrE
MAAVEVIEEPRLVLDARAELGECPVWAADEGVLYWTDIAGARLHRFDPATGDDHAWELPDRCGSFALRESGGALLALARGFATFDFATGTTTPLVAPDDLPDGVRFNDGKAAPDGRFFAGTMDEQMNRTLGALYRLDPDASLHRVVDGLYVSNGLAWSPDGATLYHSDSAAPGIWAYHYDRETGAIALRGELARPENEVGRPDGAATDAEGYYWSAGVSAGVLNRWSPDGVLNRRIELPVSRPTMPCFAGPDLRTLYVTSLRAAGDPGSGGIVGLRVDVPGVPVARFAG